MVLSLLTNKTKVVVPATVDEALAGVSTALEHLKNIHAEKIAEADDLAEQSKVLAEASAEARDEGERAIRVHGNISALLS